MQNITVRLVNTDTELSINLSKCQRECSNADLLTAAFQLARSLGMDSYDEAEIIRDGKQIIIQSPANGRANYRFQ